MYTRVFVVVPISVAPAAIWSTSIASLARHECGGSEQTLEARFERLSGIGGELSDPEAEGLLPARDKRILRNRISFVRNLSTEEVPAALVLPSGSWHGSADYGWAMIGEEDKNTRAWTAWEEFYQQTLKNHRDDYIVEIWVHS